MRHYAILPIILAVLALTPAVFAEANSEDFSNIGIVVASNRVFARADNVDPENPPQVSARIIRPNGSKAALGQAPASVTGDTEISFYPAGLRDWWPVTIQPGDRVVFLSDAGHTAEVPVPRIAIDTVAAGRVSGTAEPGARLTVTGRDPAGHADSQTVTANGDGAWSVSLDPDVVFEPGTWGSAFFVAAGVVFQSLWVADAVEAPIGADWINVWAPPGQVVTAATSAGSGRGWTDRTDGEPASVWLHDSEADGTPLLPGETLTVTLTGRAQTYPIPAISAAVDPSLDRVIGTAPAGAALTVSADGTEMTVTADHSGAWSADFTELDVTLDTWVRVQPVDAPWTHLIARAPHLATLDPGRAAVRGFGAAGQPVTLLVEGPDGTLRGGASDRVGPDGEFELTAERGGVPVAWASGDVARVTIGESERRLPASPPSVTADGAADEVAGTAIPGSTIRVAVDGSEVVVTADPAGNWEAAFAGMADIVPGAEVQVSIQRPDGPVTELTFPAFRATAQIETPRVIVEGPPGLTASAEIERDGEVIGTGACQVPAAPVSDPSAQLILERPLGTSTTACGLVLTAADATPIAILPDDTLLVFPSTGGTAVLDVVPLFAHIDLGGRDVVGLAPPSGQVHVEFGALVGEIEALPVSVNAGTDSAGVFDHELSAGEWGLLKPGLYADVTYADPSGHRVLSRALIEQLRPVVGATSVGGLAEPGSEVTVSVQRGDERVEGSSVADPDGWAEIALPEGWQGLKAADVVRFEHRRGLHTLEVPVAAAWLDPNEGDTLAFGFDAFSTVRSAGISHTGDAAMVRGQPSTDGVVWLPPTALDRSDLGAAALLADQPNGDQLLWPLVYGTPSRIRLPISVQRSGW